MKKTKKKQETIQNIKNEKIKNKHKKLPRPR